MTSPIAHGELARLSARALEAGGAPTPASLGLVLSNDRELAQINQQHMGEGGPTDVLSFPLLPAGAFPTHAGQTAQARAPEADESVPFTLPPARRPHLGDVVVSVERAQAQANEGRGGQTGQESWSPADELRLLVVHGTLHICGWDHTRAEEEAAMRALERRILEATR